jgi:Anthranilate synthase component I, N terminal region
VRAHVGPVRTGVPGDAEVHRAEFAAAAEDGFNLVPVYTRFTSDQLTPVTAYRCLVDAADTDVPSFLFESVQNGTDTGRYSFVGARPTLEILAKGTDVTILDHAKVRACPHAGAARRLYWMHMHACMRAARGATGPAHSCTVLDTV